MKIGGMEPYGLAPIPVPLASGEEFFPPPMEAIAMTGPSTQVQWWDQQYQIWRVMIPVSSTGLISADGANIRFVNITGAISVASFTAGSGAVNGIGQAATGVTLAVSAPGANGRQAFLAPIVGGVPAAPAITVAGTGLLVPPLLISSPPPLGGITQQLVCQVSGGAITVLTQVVAGAGYLTPPTVTVVPQVAYYPGSVPPSPGTQSFLGGSNFPATNFLWPPWQISNTGVFTILPVITSGAIGSSGTLTGTILLDAGALYTGTPTVVVTGAGAATVTLNAVTAAANDSGNFLQPVTI
jgi:hypothetical protein